MAFSPGPRRDDSTMSGSKIEPIPRQARAFQGQPAGVVTRLIAALVDAAVVAVALVGGYLGVAGFQFLLRPRNFQFPDPTIWLGLTADAVILTLYLTIAWGAGGRTYGNTLMGLRVVNASGGRAGWGRAAARAVAYVVFPAGLLWVAVDRRSRSIQDLVLRTAVVYDWRPQSARESSARAPGARDA